MTPGSMFDQLREASHAVSTYIVRHLPKGAETQLNRRVRDQLAQGDLWASPRYEIPIFETRIASVPRQHP